MWPQICHLRDDLPDARVSRPRFLRGSKTGCQAESAHFRMKQKVNARAVIDACAETNTGYELNASPNHLDICTPIFLQLPAGCINRDEWREHGSLTRHSGDFQNEPKAD